MKLYKTKSGIIVESHDGFFEADIQDWDKFINDDSLLKKITLLLNSGNAVKTNSAIESQILAPVGKQELWACGVTYLRSKVGRQEESKVSGGADFYAKVYEAERPEVFFKATPNRIVGHNDKVRIRKDSTWDVPEPELALYINSSGLIQGYTIGNDMSSRSIEGENPLYLPQAKVYEKSAALGPCLYIPEFPIALNTSITLNIFRNEHIMFQGSTTLERMKRTLQELADYLFQECDFSAGCYLMTGTCLVPSNSFTLQVDDRIEIEIADIGIMVNKVNKRPARMMTSSMVSGF